MCKERSQCSNWGILALSRSWQKISDWWPVLPGLTQWLAFSLQHLVVWCFQWWSKNLSCNPSNEETKTNHVANGQVQVFLHGYMRIPPIDCFGWKQLHLYLSILFLRQSGVSVDEIIWQEKIVTVGLLWEGCRGAGRDLDSSVRGLLWSAHLVVFCGSWCYFCNVCCIFDTSLKGCLVIWRYSIGLYLVVFIGPESDHWQCLSLTHSLPNKLRNV